MSYKILSIENIRKSIQEFNNSNSLPTIQNNFIVEEPVANINLIDKLIKEIVPLASDSECDSNSNSSSEEVVNLVEEKVNINAELANNNDTIVREKGKYDLDKHKYRISQIEYRKLISKNKKQVYTNPNGTVVYDSQEELLEKLEEQKYKKKWGRLSIFCKKDRLKEYTTRMVSTGQIPNDKQEIIFKHLCNMVNSGMLTKKDDIEYSETNGSIDYINTKHLDI